MTDSADVTIVIPVWGRYVSYLPEAVSSLVAQVGPRTRILVVDNASAPPVREFGGAQVLRCLERLSSAAVRNCGLAEVSSPFVIFWDVDDVMVPGTLDWLWRTASADRRIVAVATASIGWNELTGAEMAWPWPRSWSYSLSRFPRLFAVLGLLVSTFPTTGPVLLRTAAVQDAGGFSEDVEYFEDWGLQMTLTLRGRVVMDRRIGRRYRVHHGSLSHEHLGHATRPQWLARLRDRVRRDHAAPRWLRAVLPLVALFHTHVRPRIQGERFGAGFYESALSAEPERPGDRGAA